MPRRSRDTQGNSLPKIHTSPHSHPSLFFIGYEVEHTIGEPSENFDEPIGGEEELVSPEEPASPIQTMAETEAHGAFPIIEANRETKIKNINPSSLPHFHELTSKDPDTFMFEFYVFCRTYDYASDDQKRKLFQSTLKDATLHWFMGLPGNSITTWA